MLYHGLRSGLLVAGAIATLVLGITACGPTNIQAADPDEPEPVAIPVPVGTSFQPMGYRNTKSVAVFVRMSGDPVAVEQARAGSKLDRARKDAIKADLKSRQDTITGAIGSRGGTVVAQLQSAINGIQVQVSQDQVAGLASLPGVVEVVPLETYVPTHSVSVPHIGAPAPWDQTSFRGDAGT